MPEHSARVAGDDHRPVARDTHHLVCTSLPGEPPVVSAAGVTRSETPLLTLENPSAFDPASTRLRLVIVGGLDGDEHGRAQAVLAAVRWIKGAAPKAIRDRWIVSALPMADPDGRARTHPFHFPPAKGFYDNPDQPESRYVWRWVTYQAPDLLVEIRGDAVGGDAADSLTAAFRDGNAAGLGSTRDPAVVSASAAPAGLAKVLAGVHARSPLHARDREADRAQTNRHRPPPRGPLPRLRRRSATSHRSRGSAR